MKRSSTSSVLVTVVAGLVSCQVLTWAAGRIPSVIADVSQSSQPKEQPATKSGDQSKKADQSPSKKPAPSTPSTSDDAQGPTQPTPSVRSATPDPNVGKKPVEPPKAKPLPPTRPDEIDFNRPGGVASAEPRSKELVSNDGSLRHCDQPLGTLVVAEPQESVLRSLRGYGLQSPVTVVRLLVQQSNCFTLVESAGAGTPASDFVLTPNVVFEGNGVSGSGAAVGGLFGRRVGAIAGGLKFKEAQTGMQLAETKTAQVVAASETTTRKADLRLGTGLLGATARGTSGDYGRTNEGRIIAAALMANYNGLVETVRGLPESAVSPPGTPSNLRIK